MNNINKEVKTFLEDKMDYYKVDNAILILPTDCEHIQNLIKNISKDVKYQIIQCNIIRDNKPISKTVDIKTILPSILNISIMKENSKISNSSSSSSSNSSSSSSSNNKNFLRSSLKNSSKNLSKNIINLDITKSSSASLVKKTLQHYLKSLSNMIIKQDDKWCWAHENFLSSLSHQIKTPLNGIATGIQILEENLKDEFNRNIVNYLFQSCIELSAYVNDIIDYYLFTQDKIQFTYHKHNISETIKFIEEVYQSQIEENNIKWSTNISKTIPKYIITDGKRICQVLVNLIGNSLKFTYSGQIELDIQYLCMENKLVITVLDTGSGIPEEEINNVFNAFYQVPDKWMTTQDGLGIGLSISKKIIEGLGGQIYFIDNPLTVNMENKGVAIQLWIPNNKEKENTTNNPISKQNDIKKQNTSNINYVSVATNTIIPSPYSPNVFDRSSLSPSSSKMLSKSASQQEEEPEILLEEQSPKNKILIVEDNKTNANLLKMMIQKINNTIEVDIILNSCCAVENILTKSYDMVFLDIKMPRISGYEILDKLKKEVSINNINLPDIVVITALISQDVETKLAGYPIHGMIHKPIQIDQIRKIIR